MACGSRKARCIFILVALLLPVWQSGSAEMPDLERSVVRIINYAQRGNWYTPWDSTSVQQGSGSGFAISNQAIMTNAHVVSDSRMLILYFQGDPQPYKARVAAIGHDCDLALIQPVDRTVLNSIPSLSFGGLPALRSTVETYGFPAGGQRISSTKGIVSRIEINQYLHSSMDGHLTVQTDAAINPGNSGGPVIQDGSVVGVAFQTFTKMENISLFIPTEVISHFLEDLEDGVYDGYPDLGVHSVNLQNPAARMKAGMGGSDTGVWVDRVTPGSSAEGMLFEGDVLMNIEGFDIANDGTVELDNLRLDYGVLLDRKQIGDLVDLTVFRRGKQLDVAVEMGPAMNRQIYENIYDRLPRYYVYGGLVFIPLNRECVKALGGGHRGIGEYNLLYEYLYKQLEHPEKQKYEPIILLRRLDHPVNSDMAWHRNLVVEKINGRPVNRLEDLVEGIDQNTGRYQVFEFGYHNRFGVIDREEADLAHEGILKQYGVPRDRRL